MSTVIDEFFGVVNKKSSSQRDMRADAQFMRARIIHQNIVSFFFSVACSAAWGAISLLIVGTLLFAPEQKQIRRPLFAADRRLEQIAGFSLDRWDDQQADHQRLDNSKHFYISWSPSP